VLPLQKITEFKILVCLQWQHRGKIFISLSQDQGLESSPWEQKLMKKFFDDKHVSSIGTMVKINNKNMETYLNL
jgi:hypothetical protein